MKENIAFVAPNRSTFISLDIEILSKHFFVFPLIFNSTKKTLTPLFMIGQMFQLLFLIFFKNTRKIVVSFAGYWSFFPALLGMLTKRPVFIIVHGTDACNFPEINYGDLRKPVLRFINKKSFEWCTKILPVSESLMKTTNSYFEKSKDRNFGLLVEFENLLTPYQVIPNSFKTEFWIDQKEETRVTHSFITVATEGQFVRKGIDIIIKAASEIPDVEIFIVGAKSYSHNVSDNVHFLGRKTHEELKQLYYRSEYYLQLSVFEGFGCSLAEAMLCGCIPIGSNVNAIPEIIGDTGYLLQQRDVESLKKLMLDLINKEYDITKSKSASEKILNDFPLSVRENLLVNTLTTT